MSVKEYEQYGRSEMLRYATPGEILRVASAIGQPMSFLDGNPAF
ncbi:DNA methyltransferase [Escherichia coli]|nr:DNA methyltransferase [Escherichia coli]